MRIRSVIASIGLMIFLIGQISPPLYLHICSMNHAKFFLSSCKMHAAPAARHACCAKKAEGNGASAVDQKSGHPGCTTIYSKELSTDGAMISFFAFPGIPAASTAPLLSDVIPTDGFSSGINTFTDGSPPESPPLFLLDSAFRI